MKRMTIDEAVRWAYRDELPKVGGNGERIGPRGYGSGSLATEVARSYWCVPDNEFDLVPIGAGEEPSADAVAIYRAVQGLNLIPVEINEAWVLSDLAELGVHGQAVVQRAIEAETVVRDGVRHLRRKVSDVVKTAALVGLDEGRIDELPAPRPVTEQGMPKWYRRTTIVTEAGSFEAEVDGMDRKRRRPYADAYQKFVLVPDPILVITDRAIWHVWRSAMDVLYETVRGRLSSVDVTACEAQWMPWMHPVPSARLVKDMSVGANQPPQSKRRVRRA